jgi:hypothetical protein
MVGGIWENGVTEKRMEWDWKCYRMDRFTMKGPFAMEMLSEAAAFQVDQYQRFHAYCTVLPPLVGAVEP